jgi:hypothetical protein
VNDTSANNVLNNITLFKSLYSSIPEEIKSYVKQQRPDLSEERLMEETIVVALTEESLDLINKKLKNSPEYNNFLRKLKKKKTPGIL